MSRKRTANGRRRPYTNQLTVGEERFIHELAERAGAAGVDATTLTGIAYPQDRPRDEGWTILYSDRVAVLYRKGQLWDVKEHGIQEPSKGAVEALDSRSLFSATQQPLPDGIVPALKEGWL